MKKVALAAILALAATAASAQSSVTLYGLIDAGLTYTNNQGGAHNFQAASGSVDESNFGLKGSEDLGGGTKAIFQLEEGFNIMNGHQDENGSMFSRQAFVGLSNDRFGTVTLGRQYDAVGDELGPLSLTGTDQGGIQAAHPFDNDNLNGTFSTRNSIKYQSVTYGGFQFEGQYGFSNQSNNRAYSVGATYNYKSFNAAAGFMQMNNGGPQLGAGNSGAVGEDAPFTAGRQQTWGAGANYAFGNAQVGALFTQTRLNNASQLSELGGGTVALTGNARFNNYEVNGTYHITPAVSVATAYTFTDASINGASPKFNQVTTQVDYSLSKRTDIYLQGEYQHVSNTGNSGITADINGLAPSSNDSQVAATVGLRHRF
jgi:GBP family porin